MKSLHLKIKHWSKLSLLLSVLILNPINVFAISIYDVSPTQIDLILAPSEVVVEPVSLTIHPFLFAPIQVDVAPSDPAALAVNLTGTDINGGGGDISSFLIQFTGDNSPQNFDLIFIDTNGGPVLASIPVTISNVPIPAALPLFLSGFALLLVGARRAKNLYNL